jgi:TetR/AcrR family transcriptional repressor of nem operon
MRKSKDEAAQTREAIVAAAADHLRRTGITNSSLADMMAAAGLTHGGFYRHFRNKEQLVAEALSVAGAKSIATIRRNVEKGGIGTAVDSYLSRAHRDSAAPICPFAALGSEMARSSDEVKKAAATVLEELFITLAKGDSISEARGEAIALLCTLVGAMTLARITANSPLSEEIFKHVKHRLRIAGE